MGLAERFTKNVGKSDSMIREMFELGLKLKKEYGFANVVDLSIGNPLSEPPDEFKKSIIDLMSEDKKGLHRYMPNPGYQHVRELVANNLNKSGCFDKITGDCVIMTVGAAGGMNVVFNAIIDPEDEVILLNPYFVDYAKYVRNYGGNPVFVNTDKNFGIDVTEIEKAVTPKTKAVLINSPNNPSGRVYSEENLRRLSEILADKSKKHKKTIYIVSDEPYREIVFSGKKFYSPCSSYKNSFMVYSWSKSLSIPGERIGYIALNPEMEKRDDIFKGLILSLRILGYVNAPALMQNAIAGIINVPFNLDHYEEKRNILYDCLIKNGYELASPEGAFYMFVRYPVKKEEYLRIARENLLLVVPGEAFGIETHFRISFCIDMGTVKKACEKFDKISESLR